MTTPPASRFFETALTVAEGGSGTYTIVLDTQPTADVTVTINDPTGNTDVTADPADLTFSSTDWSTPQTVTVHAAHDADAVNDTATVTHTVTSTGTSYSSAAASSVDVTVTDDDTAGVTVFETALTVAEGGSGTYTIVLDTQPTADVTVTINDPTGNTDVTADPADLTFSSTDWSTPQTVTVHAAHDADAVNDTATVTHTVTSTGTSYSSAAASSVDVTVTDDDTAGVTVFETGADRRRGRQRHVHHRAGHAAHRRCDRDHQRPNRQHGRDRRPGRPDVLLNRLEHAADGDGARRTRRRRRENDTATVTHTVTSTGTSYSSAAANRVDVTVTDDDTAGVTVFETALTVAEGGSGTYTIVLDTQPTADVTVTINDPTGNTDVTADPADLTFSSTDWSTPQTVTVHAAHDNDAVNDTATVTHTVTSTGTSYSSAAASSVDVTVTDDDTAGVTVFETALTVAEGGSGTYTIVLDTQPTADVTVTINDPTGNTDVTADPADLTFSSTDWSTPQTVTVHAAHDNDAVNDTATVTHTVTSTGTSYSSAAANRVDVTVTDDDTAGVTVFETALTVAEGGSGTYTIVLDTQPTADVTVTINDPTGNTDVTADPADLTFSSTDWSTPQTVTVHAAHDNDAVNDTATVTHTVTSTGTSYSSAAASSVDVTVTDDDTAGVTVFETALTVAEGGSGTYTIVLDTQPTADVTVTINDPTGNTDVTADPADLTFSSTDWSTPQTVTVHAAHDNDAVNDTATVTHTVTSTGTSYSSAAANRVDVTVTDDDTAGVTVFETALTVAEGGSGTYTIVLDTQPTADVTVTINDPTGNTDVTADPADLTFSSTDWSTPQTVTVHAAHDNDAVNDTATVTHTVTSTRHQLQQRRGQQRGRHRHR